MRLYDTKKNIGSGLRDSKGNIINENDILVDSDGILYFVESHNEKLYIRGYYGFTKYTPFLLSALALCNSIDELEICKK